MNSSRLNHDELDCLLHGAVSDATVDALAGDNQPGHGECVGPQFESSSVPTTGTSAGQSSDQPSQPTATDPQQHREIQILHEALAERLAQGLSDRLRTRVQVQLVQSELQDYGEFVFSLDNPTCFQVLHTSPLPGRQCLELHPTILFPMIDRLLGGGKQLDAIVRRPLTEIELRLVRRLTDVVNASLESTWRDTLPLAISIESVQSNPKLVRCMAPDDVMWVHHFEIEFGPARGPMRLALPWAAIEQLENLIEGHRLERQRQQAAEAEASRRIDATPIDVSIVLAEVTMPRSELARIECGDIIRTGTLASTLAQVRMDGQTFCCARAGQNSGRRAIRIEERVNEAE